MAWRCTGSTNDELVSNLARTAIITSHHVDAAMRRVDRAHFAPNNPYDDAPQYIGYNVTISAPHMHAYALESLSNYLKPGMCALDIGSGSGYLTACMAAMVGTSGKAVGIEHIAELVDKSREALEQHYPEWVRSGCIKFVTGDGRQGYADDSPYDCIHVGAASPKTPTELLRQLKSPGRMFVPVGTTDQRIKVFDKDAHGNVAETDMMGVVYVPLTDETLQRNS